MVDTQGFLKPELIPVEPPVESAPDQKVEVANTPETTAETPVFEVETPKVEVSERPVHVVSIAPVIPVVKDELQTEIEDVMSKDLSEVFVNLPADKKEAFKVAGEEAASKIMTMIQAGKVRVKKILQIIRDWLRIIPSVNKYFLEQEAKIKTDAILKLVDKREKSGLIN